MTGAVSSAPPAHFAEKGGAVSAAAPPLRLTDKLFYGLGSVAFGVKDNGFSYLLLLFYNQVVGLSAPWSAWRS